MPTPVYLVSPDDDDTGSAPVLLGTAETYAVALAQARRYAGTVPTSRLMIGDYLDPALPRWINGWNVDGPCDQRVPHATSLDAIARLGRDTLAADAAARAADLKRRLTAWDAADAAARAADDDTGRAIRSLADRALLAPLPDAWTYAPDAHDDDEEAQHHDELMRLPR